VTRPQPSPHGFMAQAGLPGLGERNHAVVTAQVVIEHLK
jgi:hypothetical protein